MTDTIATLTDDQLAEMIATAEALTASADQAAERARTNAQKKAADALAEAEAAQQELQRRQEREAARVNARRRAHAHALLNGGGFEQLAQQNRAELAEAQKALQAALEADPVLIATARYTAVSQRTGAVRELLRESAVALGQELPASLANYRAPSGPDLDVLHRRALDQLTATYADEWGQALRQQTADLITGDDAALAEHIPTAEERHAANEAARLAVLEEFKAGENVERVVRYADAPGSPFLHHIIVSWRDSITGQTMPEAAPDASPGPLGILAGRDRWVPVDEATAEDVAAALAADTLTDRSAEFYGLPLPSTHQG